jgi:thymidylate synthase
LKSISKIILLTKKGRFKDNIFLVTVYYLYKTHDCTLKTLITNMKTNIFKITRAAKNIAEVFFESYSNIGRENITKIDQVSNTITQLGRNASVISHTVLSFNK